MKYQNKKIHWLIIFCLLSLTGGNVLASEIDDNLTAGQNSYSEVNGTLTTSNYSEVSGVLTTDNSSEVTGTLSTGLTATAEDALTGIVISAPTASPSADTYTSAQNINLSANNSLSIHYTTNGDEPTCASGLTYGGAVTITSSQTIKAVACYPQDITSPIATFVYTINTAPPSAPSSGSIGGGGGGGGGGSPASDTTSQGDANNDNKVDVLDFVILMANWNQTNSGNPADFNGDNQVNILDFVILMSNWTI